MIYPLAITMPGFEEWIVIAVIGLLLFGKRLPEVGRSLGKGIVEFKKGLAGVDDDIEKSVAAGRPANTAVQPTLPQQPATAHRFDPYTGKPLSPELTATPTTPTTPNA